MANSFAKRVLAAGALALATALACAPADAHKGCHGHAVYKVTFHFKWSAKTHRTYPQGGHFSPPTVASHSAAYQMWAPGSFASQGIQNVAETGNPMVLREQLGEYMKARHVGNSAGARKPTPNGTTKVSLRIKVGGRTPYLSAATMAAPSPDWFTGFHGLDMCGRRGWRNWRSGPLILYDAGTDSGRRHMAEDKKTMPPTTISSLRFGFPAFGRAFGWYSVRRIR